MLLVTLSFAALFVAMTVCSEAAEYGSNRLRVPLTRVMQEQSLEMLSPALQKTSLENFQNVQYIGTIFMGKDKQPMRVMFDTGSNWLWVPHTNCSGCSETQKISARACEFVPSAASATSCKLIQNTSLEQIHYSTGYIEGIKAMDSVTLEPPQQTERRLSVFGQNTDEQQQQQASSVGKLPAMYFISVTRQDHLEGFTAHGIFGLGFSTRDSQMNHIPTYLDSLKVNGYVERKLFTFYFSSDARGAQEQESFVTFGYLDEAFVPGQNDSQIAYFAVSDSTYWSFDIDTIYVGNETLVDAKNDAPSDSDPLSHAKVRAIADTGSSLVAVPQEHLRALVQLFETKYGIQCVLFPAFGADGDGAAQQRPQCECSSISYQHAFPPITLEAKDTAGRVHNLTLPPHEYVLQERDVCYLQMMPRESAPVRSDVEYWVLGMNFLRGFYSIFDQDNMRIGLVSTAAHAAPQASLAQVITQFIAYTLLLVIVGALCYALSKYLDRACEKRKNRPIIAQSVPQMPHGERPARDYATSKVSQRVI